MSLPPTCNVCNTRFFHTNDYNQHVEKSECARKLSCPKCDSKFATRIELDRHVQPCAEFLMLPAFVCEECNLTLGSYVEKEWHCRKYTCRGNWCDYTVNCNVAFDNHKKSHRLARLTKKYACSICSMSLNTQPALDKHCIPNMCFTCGVTVRCHTAWPNHVCSDRETVEPLTPLGNCKKCNVKFYSDQSAFYHACTSDFPRVLTMEEDKAQQKLYQEQLQQALSISLDEQTPEGQRLVEHDAEMDELAAVMELSLKEFQGEEAALRASSIEVGMIPGGFHPPNFVFRKVMHYDCISINTLRLVCRRWDRIVSRYYH